MLKITINKRESETNIKLEGRLTGPWAAELRQAVMECGNEQDSIHLNLQELHFVDQQGLTALLDLSAWGVRLSSVPPFIQELLKAGHHNSGQNVL